MMFLPLLTSILNRCAKPPPSPSFAPKELPIFEQHLFLSWREGEEWVPLGITGLWVEFTAAVGFVFNTPCKISSDPVFCAKGPPAAGLRSPLPGGVGQGESLFFRRGIAGSGVSQLT